MSGRRLKKFRQSLKTIVLSATVGAFASFVVVNANLSGDHEGRSEREKTLPRLESSTGPVAEQTSVKVAGLNLDAFRPGWIARTYRSPDLPSYNLPKQDVGAFVLDEIRFDLLTHKSHGIMQPGAVAYRLQGYYLAKLDGQYQFGIDVKFNRFGKSKPLDTRKCRLSLKVGGRTIFENIVSLSKSEPIKFVDGAVRLERGLLDAEAIVFCDIGSEQNGADVKLCITVREPGAARFAARRNAFMHYAASEVGPMAGVTAQ